MIIVYPLLPNQGQLLLAVCPNRCRYHNRLLEYLLQIRKECSALRQRLAPDEQTGVAPPHRKQMLWQRKCLWSARFSVWGDGPNLFARSPAYPTRFLEKLRYLSPFVDRTTPNYGGIRQQINTRAPVFPCYCFPPRISPQRLFLRHSLPPRAKACFPGMCQHLY